DAGGIDLAILDGEAQPNGGMGLCRQLKNELTDCPPIVIAVRSKDDRWLATWSQADAVIVHPLDPIAAADTVADVLRAHRVPAVPVAAVLRAQRVPAVWALYRSGAKRSHAWPNLLNRVVAGENLSPRETVRAMDQMMSGEATPSQIAVLAVGLRAKGETPDGV